MLEVDFANQPTKYFRQLIKSSPKTTTLIAAQIEALRQNPTPSNSLKLVNYPCYRVRVGNHRIIYEYDDECLYIVIIDKRERAYKRLKSVYTI